MFFKYDGFILNMADEPALMQTVLALPIITFMQMLSADVMFSERRVWRKVTCLVLFERHKLGQPS